MNTQNATSNTTPVTAAVAPQVPGSTRVIATTKELSPIPAGANPFHHDESHMGTELVRGWVAMHQGYDRKDDPMALPYIILVNTRSGQRIQVDLTEKEATPA